jgi:hypothetical protein
MGVRKGENLSPFLFAAFSKSTKAQNNFFFLLFKISKNENNVKILSVVEYDFLNPNWFSSNQKTSSENTCSLSFKIAVNSLPRQLRMVIGQKFFFRGKPIRIQEIILD